MYANLRIVPWVVWGFFKLITPFIDPLTKEKLKFNDDMRQHVPPQQLWNEFHGDLEFEYDHATYWPALLKLCEERRTEQRERWVKAGKHYGESETYIKGGNAPSVGQASAPETLQTAEKGKEDILLQSAPESSPETQAPIQSHGIQANGNLDVATQAADPILTTEGDRK
jgi:hypothetical protein